MLIHEEGNDYLLPAHESECWITIAPFNLHIQHQDNSITIDVWSAIDLTEVNPMNSITVYHPEN